MSDTDRELILPARASLQERVAFMSEEQEPLWPELRTLFDWLRAELEVDAERVLPAVLEQRGYQVLADPGPIAVDGEVAVAVPVRDRDGRQLWAVVQAKARLHRADVRALARSLRSAQFRSRLAEGGVAGPLLPYAFGLRVYRDAEEEGLLSGEGILGPRGERIPPRAPIA